MIPGSRLAELEQKIRDQLDSLAPDLEQRRAEGRAIDGHGDLHLDHVFFETEDSSPLLIDCLEFNEDLRKVDAASEVAFLAMDLRYRDREDLAEWFLSSYASETDDYGLFPVVNLFSAYRAMVRAKVAALASLQTSISEPQRRNAAHQRPKTSHPRRIASRIQTRPRNRGSVRHSGLGQEHRCSASRSIGSGHCDRFGSRSKGDGGSRNDDPFPCSAGRRSVHAGTNRGGLSGIARARERRRKEWSNPDSRRELCNPGAARADFEAGPSSRGFTQNFSKSAAIREMPTNVSRSVRAGGRMPRTLDQTFCRSAKRATKSLRNGRKAITESYGRTDRAGRRISRPDLGWTPLVLVEEDERAHFETSPGYWAFRGWSGLKKRNVP